MRSRWCTTLPVRGADVRGWPPAQLRSYLPNIGAASSVKWIVAAGGYRSGSTLQYNVVGRYVEMIGAGQRYGLVEPDEVKEFIAHNGRRSGVGVVKCHHATHEFSEFRSPTAWADLVDAGTAAAMVTTRDIDEVKRSMCRKFAIADEDIEDTVLWKRNNANCARWRELAVVESPYEALTTDPTGELRRIVRRLGLPWRRRSAARAASETSLSRSAAVMAQVERGEWDPLTLLHWDHIDPGRLEPDD